MKITNHRDWMNGDFLRLGVQTNPGHTVAVAHWKANQWAPKKAKSYTLKLHHTDYHGRGSTSDTGYADAYIEYFTTLKEGTCAVDRDATCPSQEKQYAND